MTPTVELGTSQPSVPMEDVNEMLDFEPQYRYGYGDNRQYLNTTSFSQATPFLPPFNFSLGSGFNNAVYPSPTSSGRGTASPQPTSHPHLDYSASIESPSVPAAPPGSSPGSAATSPTMSSVTSSTTATATDATATAGDNENKPTSKRKRDNRYKNASPSVLSRRRAQNRASQRAYRERKDQRIKDLESMLSEERRKNEALGRSYAEMQAEYVRLCGVPEQARGFSSPGSQPYHHQQHQHQHPPQHPTQLHSQPRSSYDRMEMGDGSGNLEFALGEDMLAFQDGSGAYPI